MKFVIREIDVVNGFAKVVATVDDINKLKEYFNSNSTGWKCGMIPDSNRKLDFVMIIAEQ